MQHSPYRRFLLCFFLTALASDVSAQTKQEPLSDVQAAEVRRLARRLGTTHTDWILYRDVCDKIRAIGPAAIPVLRKEYSAFKDRSSSFLIKYVVRLGRIVTEMDPEEGTDEIMAAFEMDDTSLASFAARILGRTRAKGDRIAKLLTGAYRRNEDTSVRSALLCAMADCGHPSLFPFIERLLLEKKIKSADKLHYFSQLALAICSTKEHMSKARKWLEKSDSFQLAAILMAKKFRDAKSEDSLIKLCEGWNKPHKEEALQALAALASKKGIAFVEKMRSDRISDPNRDTGSGVVVLMSSELDPALLALFRLGRRSGLDWAATTVKRTGQFSTPTLSIIPSFAGSWKVPGAKAMLATWAGFKNEKGWGSAEGNFGATRVSIGSGYCHMKDTKGLRILIDMLLDRDYQSDGAMGRQVLSLAQNALHEFVGNADRPEYFAIAIFPGEGAAQAAAAPDPVKLGKAWSKWLDKNKAKLKWRKPRLNLMSTLEIY